MNEIKLITDFIQQSVTLGGMTLAILVLLCIIGIAPVLHFFPRAEALRWPIYAPVAGLALVTIAGLPLSLLGVPVKQWALVFACCLAGLSFVALLRCRLSISKRRLLYTYLQRRYRILLPIVIVPVIVSTFLMTHSNGGKVQDVWGSGDYGAYWIVAEFVQGNGANIDSYLKQNTYFASDIKDHLVKHARLGCMVYLAFLGTLLSPEELHHIINPSIVAAIIIMLALAFRWLELEKVRNYWIFAVLLFYPYLYFLLYFTYASQATGVLLFIASLLLVSQTVSVRQAAKSGNIKKHLLAGMLAGAALIHYPSMIFAIAICGILLFFAGMRTRTLSQAFIWLAAILFVGCYYLPQVIHELIWASTSSKLPGWDWQSLIGSFEFTGIRSVLGYNLPEPLSLPKKLLDAFGCITLVFMLIYGMFLCRVRTATLTVVNTTGLLFFVAIWKYYHHIPHASSTVVKTLSTFAPWLLLICMLPIARLVKKKNLFVSLTLATIAGIVVFYQIRSIHHGTLQRPWYTDALITLSRRQLNNGNLIMFNPHIHWEMTAPIVRDTRRLVDKESSDTGSYRILSRRQLLDTGETRKIYDREGDYIALENK